MIVSNTTPISNFIHLNGLDILQKLFKTIHIPKAVYLEVDAWFADNFQWKRFLENRLFVIHEVETKSLIRNFFQELHPGEKEALCLYVEKNAQLCLLDDKDARILARSNGVSTAGTLGILIKAKEAGIIESVKEKMDILRNDHQFWISEFVYQNALKLADEK